MVSGAVFDLGRDGAGGGEDDDVGSKVGVGPGVGGEFVKLVAEGGKGNLLVALALDVPLFAASRRVPVSDDVATFVAGAAVVLDLVELARALYETIDETLEVIGREVFKVMGVVGGGRGGQGLAPVG